MKTSIGAVAAGAAVCVTALLAAAPVSADDDTYLTTLEMIGVTVDDPAAAIAMGRDACARLDQGVDLLTVADQLSAERGLTQDDAAYLVGVAVGAYCDHHGDAVERVG